MSSIFNMSEMVSLALHSIIIIAARDNQLINVKKIAEILGVSESHLAKVLQELAKKGYVRSTRGPKGGFTLAKEADEIRLLDIYETIEGPLNSDKCPVDSQKCVFNNCIFGGIPEKLNQEFAQYMINKTVSELMDELKFV